MIAKSTAFLLTALLFQADPGRDDLAKQAIAKQQGAWFAASSRRDGIDAPDEIVRTITRTVEKDHVVWKRDGKSFAGTTIVLDPSRTPAEIDVIPDGGPSKGKHVLGIYQLKDERLEICMADADQPRPREFKAEKGSRQTLMVFSRTRPGAHP